MPLKAFRLNDYEAWAGEDLDDAIANCMKACGVPREGAYDDCHGDELPGDMEIAGEPPGTFVKVSEILADMEKRGEPGPVCFFGEA